MWSQHSSSIFGVYDERNGCISIMIIAFVLIKPWYSPNYTYILLFLMCQKKDHETMTNEFMTVSGLQVIQLIHLELKNIILLM